MASYQDKLDSTIRLMIDRVGLSNIVPGTMAFQIAQAFAYESYLQDLKIENTVDDNSIVNSTSTKLDDIGNNFLGMPRLEEVPPFISPSMKVLKFSVTGGRIFGDINNNSDIILPQGTLIYGSVNGAPIKFALDSTQVLQAGNSYQYISAILTQGPSDSIPANVLTKHSFKNYADYNNGSLLVTNTMQINTGRPKEEDDSYRYSISTGLRSFNQANTDGILSLVRSVQGVSDATIYQAKDGAGTFTIYVKGITPITSDETITNVTAALLQECVSPWTCFNVVKPSYIGLSFAVSITLKSQSTVTDLEQYRISLQNTIESYVNNFNGKTFYWGDLSRIILDSNTNIIDVTFSNCYQYVGDSTFRQQISVDPYETKSIDILDTEKIIIEPISYPISVTLQ